MVSFRWLHRDCLVHRAEKSPQARCPMTLHFILDIPVTVPRVPRVDLSTVAPPRSASDSLLTAVGVSSRFLEKTHQPIRDSVAATAA
jgi:hypothetical protein